MSTMWLRIGLAIAGAVGAFSAGSAAAEWSESLRYGSDFDRQTVDICATDRSALANKNELVVLIHGGGWSSGSSSSLLPLCKRIARLGYIAASPNYRLADGSMQNAWPAQRDDIVLALKWIAEQRPADAPLLKVCFIGFSAGAQIALKIAELQPKALQLGHAMEFSCVIDNFGPVNLVELPAEMRSAVCRLLGTANDALCSRRAEEVSKLALSRPFPRVLVVHGLEDTLVPHKQSRDLVELIRSAGGYARLISYQGGHSYARLDSKTTESIWELQFGFLKSSFEPGLEDPGSEGRDEIR